MNDFYGEKINYLSYTQLHL